MSCIHGADTCLHAEKHKIRLLCFQSISFGQTHLYWRDIIISPFWLRTMIIDIMVANCPVERERAFNQAMLSAVFFTFVL